MPLTSYTSGRYWVPRVPIVLSDLGTNWRFPWPLPGFSSLLEWLTQPRHSTYYSWFITKDATQMEEMHGARYQSGRCGESMSSRGMSASQHFDAFTNLEVPQTSLLRGLMEVPLCRHGLFNHWPLVVKLFTSPSLLPLIPGSQRRELKAPTISSHGWFLWQPAWSWSHLGTHKESPH